MCEEIKVGERKNLIPKELLTEHYTYLSAFDYRRDRLLFCNKCAKETSHEIIRLIEPLSELEILQKQNNNSDFKKAESVISHLQFEIGHRNYDSFLLFNRCRVCDSVIVDLCKSDSPGHYMVIRVYPRELHLDLPEPNQDMTPECLKIYKEASDVFPASPRASAALMRLCLQQYLVHKEIAGKTLNDQIKSLEGTGVPDFVMKFMQVCRVAGNSSVHPKVEIDVNEDPEVARALFDAMNIIVMHLDTFQRMADESYSKLPEKTRMRIEQCKPENPQQ